MDNPTPAHVYPSSLAGVSAFAASPVPWDRLASDPVSTAQQALCIEGDHFSHKCSSGCGGGGDGGGRRRRGSKNARGSGNSGSGSRSLSNCRIRLRAVLQVLEAAFARVRVLVVLVVWV